MDDGLHVGSLAKGSFGLCARNGEEKPAQNAILLDVVPQHSQAFFQFSRQADVFRCGFAQAIDAAAVNAHLDQITAGTAAEIQHPCAQ